jgi:hypothetical protein
MAGASPLGFFIGRPSVQFSDDLFKLRGRVISARPNVQPDFVNNALNDRLRQILDHRTFWADLMKFGILPFPDPYTTGTISVAAADATVTGSGTAWPVSDVVNTTIAAGVPEFGYAEVTPVSMAGITPQSILYVDAAGTPDSLGQLHDHPVIVGQPAV